MRVCLDVTILTQYDGVLAGISRTIFFFLKNAIQLSQKQSIAFVVYKEKERAYSVLSYSESKELAKKIDKTLAELDFESVYSNRDFSSQDKLFLMGEQWLYEGLFDSLRALKKQTSLKVVSIAYDIVPYFNPEYYWDGFPEKYIDYLKEMIDISEGVLSISECTSKDLKRFITEQNLKTLPIKFIRLGDNFFEPTGKTVKKDAGKYILCVGTVQPRKNPYCVYFAYLQLLEKMGPSAPDLIFVGTKGWNVENFYYFVKTNPLLKNKIHFKEKITDQELLSLYAGCEFSIYPSFYEGWGLPIAESVSLGKLCIASNSSSMTEIAGDLIEYHSPYNPNELSEKMLKYAQNPEALKNKEEELKKKYVVRTWKDFSVDTIEFLSSI